MSKETKRKLSLLALGSLTIGLSLLFFSLGFRDLAPTRTLTLVAKDMAFYLEGLSEVNPTLELVSGEKVRLHFINRDRGIEHDLVLPQLALHTGKISFGESAVLEFRSAELGWFDYLCSLHPAMMRGKVAVLTARPPKSIVSAK